MRKLRIVDENRWNAIDERLTAAAAARPELAPVVEVITRPVRHLMLMAAETPGALGNDVLAAERLRLLLIGSSPAQALVPLAAAALRKHATDKRLVVKDPGLLLPGALAVVALAAARVASDARAAVEMVNTVHGLALEASPVEMLVRLEPYGAPLDALDAMLRLLVPHYTLAHAVPDFITQVMLDANERGRWGCLARLFAGKTFVKPDAWEVSDADGISEVLIPQASVRRSADVKASVVRGPDVSPSAVRIAELGASVKPPAQKDRFVVLRGTFDRFAEMKTWPKDLAIVFASEESTVAGVVQGSDVLDFDVESIRVRVPEGVSGGWVGFDHLNKHARADEARLLATAALEKLEIPCPWGGLPPVKMIPLYGRATPAGPAMVNAVPPRTGANALPDGLSEATLPGAGGGLRSATIVLFRPAVVDVDVDVDGDGEADDHGTNLPPVTYTQVEQRAIAVLPSKPTIIELPWVEDPLAVVPTGIAGSDDPRLLALLEELSAAAARVPKLEHALFLMVLPGDAPISIHTTAAAARAVAVCSWQTLGPLLTQVLVDGPADDEPAIVAVGASPMRNAFPAKAVTTSLTSKLRQVSRLSLRPLAMRLRLIGRLLPNGQVELEMPREDLERAAAAGAPIDSEVAAVALNRAGAELHRMPLQVLRTGSAPRFCLLLPLSPEVAAVELRRGTTLLKRLVRQDEAPSIVTAPREEAPRIEGGLLTWSLVRATAARVEVSVEFLVKGIWAPLLRGIDGCLGEVALPFHHIAGAESLRLVVSDGWRTAMRELPVPADATFGPMLVRRVSERVFWADGIELPGLSWEREVPGGRAKGRIIKFAKPFAGSLTLRSTGEVKAILDKRLFREGV